MENITLSVHWFWIINVGTILVVMFLGWKYYKTRKKFYAIIVLIIFVLSLANPIKFTPPTTKVNALVNSKVESIKVLPDKVEDKSYELRKQLKGISQEDLK